MRERKKQQFHNKNRHKLWLALGLLILGWMLSLMARHITGFADGYYRYVYRFVSVLVAFLSNLLPFSIAELSLYLLCLLLLGAIVYGVIITVRRKRPIKTYWISFLGNLMVTVAIIFILYVTLCGINYQKTGFAKKEGFHKEQYRTEDLIQVCENLTKEINTLNKEDITYTNLRESARQAMENLSETYQSLTGYYPKPKWLLMPELLSYQQVSGVYAFYTVEANYNSDMTTYQQPFTMCHELAHLKGVMREEEANFVAYLACMNSDNPAFKYSGVMLAYSYCMNELYNRDENAFGEIRGKLCEKANEDILKKHAFWKKYEGTISDIQSKVNDAYLKANSQEAGVSSYDEVVALIVNYNCIKNYNH